MASLSNGSGGSRMIQFSMDGRRRTIRLGSVPKKAAESVRLRVEALVLLAITRQPMDTELANWVATIGDDLATKLANVGLISQRADRVTLASFLSEYRERYAHEWSAGTRTQNVQRCENLIQAFGADRGIHTITEADAVQFLHRMREGCLSDSTISRRLRAFKTYFAEAIAKKLITSNPFENVRCGDGDVSARRRYIPADEILRMIQEANPCWQTILAISRFAGLRTPSETLMLKIENVSLANNRMVIESIKTAERVMPITSTLRPYIVNAIQTAPPGAVYVVHGDQADNYRETSNSEGGWLNTNLRTQFMKLAKRASIEVWPKPFHNLRASCETDLNAEFPAHVVAKWMGHSVAVAEKHYLQVRDSDIDRASGFTYALQNALQTGADIQCQEMTSGRTREGKALESQRMSVIAGGSQDGGVTRQGFEP